MQGYYTMAKSENHLFMPSGVTKIFRFFVSFWFLLLQSP